MDIIGAADCTIYLDSSSSWPSHPPVITDPIYGYIYPEGTYANDDRNIVVADGDTINLSCVGNSFSDSDLYGEEFVAARYVGETIHTGRTDLYLFLMNKKVYRGSVCCYSSGRH